MTKHRHGGQYRNHNPVRFTPQWWERELTLRNKEIAGSGERRDAIQQMRVAIERRYGRGWT